MHKALEICVLFLLFAPFGVNAQTPDPVETRYTGVPVNLMRLPIFTLYSGTQMEPLARDLDFAGIAETIADRPGAWRVETHITMPASIRQREEVWLQLKGDVNAAQILLNGDSLLQNGRVGGEGQAEVGGRFRLTRAVPVELWRTGDEQHVVIHFSNLRFPSGTRFFELLLGPSTMMEQLDGPHVYGPLFLCGVFLLAVCINLSFFLALKKRPVFLLQSALFVVCLWSMTEHLVVHKFTVDAAYRHLYFMGRKLDYFAFILLTAVLLSEFAQTLKPRLTWRSGLLVLAVTGVMWQVSDHTLNFFFISLIPLCLCLWAWRRSAVNGPALSAALMLVCGFIFLDESNLLDPMTAELDNPVIVSLIFYSDYLGFVLFAFVMVIVSTRSIIAGERRLDLVLLKSSRLEAELLRKQIQPHFLMNSLMSLQHLIGSDRQTAVAMVDALSEEFQLMRTMSGQTLVSFEQELAVCRVHLQIMSMQQRAEYNLEVVGVDLKQTIPPAVFHTLIENGLTHGYSGRQNGLFQLSGEPIDAGFRYRLFNDSSNTSVGAQPGSGTGLAYVRARLEEAYPSRWSLVSQACTNGWEVILEVPEYV